MTDALTAEMTEIWQSLEHQERLAVIRLSRRIYKGQLEYSKLDLVNDKRDFKAEIGEELDDAEIYSVYDALRTELKAGK